MGSCGNKMVKKPIILFFGGSSGVVKAMIKYFNIKYKVISFYNKNKPPKIKDVAYKKLDLQNEKKIISTIKKIGLENSKIILINFASIKIDKISMFVNKIDIEKTFKINTFSFLKIIQLILPKMMKNKWGRIINISSTGGLDGDKGTLLYSSSKNASHSMIKIMSKEYGAFNITFNTLALGNFNYGLFKKLDKKLRKKILNKIPSKKTGDVKNIYNAIQFLVDSDYVNGSLIKIDGGF